MKANIETKSFINIDRRIIFRERSHRLHLGAAGTSSNTLKLKSHGRRHRDGVHDARSEERLGHIQLAAEHRGGGQGGPRRPRAQGVRVAVRGPRGPASAPRPRDPRDSDKFHSRLVEKLKRALGRSEARREERSS